MDNNNLPNTDNLPELDISAYKLTPKYEEWQRLYLDKNNTVTFGNSTRAALIAYNLDEATQYGSARVIGHENLTKLNNLRTLVNDYLQENGFTLPVFLNHALQKMSTDNSDRWWKNLLMLAGLIDPKRTVINNTATAGAAAKAEANTSNDFIQISPEEEKRLSREFAEFVDSKYRGKPAMNPDAPQGTSG